MPRLEGGPVVSDERDADRALELYNAFFGTDTSPLTGGTLENESEYDDETDEE